MSRWVVGVALLFGILLFLLPDTDEASLSKIATASMLMCSSEVRDEVARQVIGQESVSVVFTNTCPELIATLEVDGSGEIVITGNKHPTVMTLWPVVEAGAVRWRCQGEPAALVTKLCKPM